jgi:translation initiation factor 2 beta subunit (eIF-2beta)/eIF-5
MISYINTIKECAFCNVMIQQMSGGDEIALLTCLDIGLFKTAVKYGTACT